MWSLAIDRFFPQGTVPLLGKPHLKAKVDLTSFLSMTQESQHDPPVATAIPTNCYRQQIYKKRQQQQQKQQHDSIADKNDNSNNKGETFDELLKSSDEFKITKMENMEIYKDTSCQCRKLCDLGCSVLTGLPCCHQLALADAVGHDIKEFMRSADTTDGWQQQ